MPATAARRSAASHAKEQLTLFSDPPGASAKAQAQRSSTGALGRKRGRTLARATVEISGLEESSDSPFNAEERRALPVLEVALNVIGPGQRDQIISLIDRDLFDRFISERETAVVDARAVAGHYLNTALGWSHTAIGRIFDCDRTTAYHHTNRISDFLSCDAFFAERYEEFASLLR